MLLPITSATAAGLALVYLALTARVVAARGRAGASLGDGSSGVIPAGQEHTVPLLVACRAHANFAEYAPLALLLLAFNELAGAQRWLVLGIAAALVLGRLLHPIGLARRAPNAARLLSMMLTLASIGVAALALLARLFV